MDPKPSRFCRLLEELERRDTPTFVSLPAFTAAVTQPTVIASADFNGDGFADIAVGNGVAGFGTPSVDIALGDGTGNFTPAGSITSLILSVPKSILATDLNRDGIIDLAIASSSNNTPAAGSLLVFLGKGDGAFSGPTLQSPIPTLAVAAADFNGDGFLDLIAVVAGTQANEPGYQFYRGTGTGAFAIAPVQPLPVDLNRVITGDFDKDGFPDFIAFDTTDQLFVPMFGNGKGSFVSTGPGFVGLKGRPFDAVSADFTGDGLPDLVVALDTGIVLIPNLGNRQFDGNGIAITTTNPSGATPVRLATTDVDRNGTPDLIAVGFNDAQVFTNDGTGKFTPDPDSPFAIPGLTAAADVAVGDINGDGVIDFITTRQGSDGTAGNGHPFLNLAPIPTQTFFGANPNPATENQPVTLTGTILFGGKPLPVGTLPTGQVQFTSDGIALGTANVVNGPNNVATFTTTFPAGIHQIVAAYLGDARFEASSSLPFPFRVDPPTTQTFQYQVTGLPTLPGLGPDRVAAGQFVERASPAEGGSPVRDIVLGSGPGRPAEVDVIDGDTRQTILSAFPFGDYSGGVMVAAGDIDGDGIDDLAVSADTGGGPRVRIYLTRGSQLVPTADFFALDPTFFGGARVALGDINGDGHADLVVVGGPGAGPRVATYDGLTLQPGHTPERLFNDFFAMDPSLRLGLFVAAGDLNGDGKAEIAVSSDVGGGPQVNVFDGAALLHGETQPVAEFFGGNPDSRGGLRIAIADVSPENLGIELITGDGPGAGSTVRVYSGPSIYSGPPRELFENEAFPGFNGGVYVA